jgi:hypothetical protein
MRHQFRTRRFLLAAALLAASAVVACVVLPAAAVSTGSRLQADIVATNHGPLPACSQDGSDCGPANIVRYFIYVDNKNQLENVSGRTRADVPGAFVVSRIDTTVFVDGVDTYDFFYTVPPDPNYPPYSGHWPVAVTCPSGAPCNEVSSPAILPGENAAAFYIGWAHGSAEPDGVYVFRFTVHGTLDGRPVDLTASSQPIRMTR